jgi:transcriptional regulator with XRE-family HTH domain
MVADSDQSPLPARRLAERLRDFRERKRLTQRQLATAIGGADPLSVATISQWENPGSGRLPPPQRLAMYARLFCTGRSFASGAPRLLGDDELTEQEREREGDLYTELLALREGALPAPDPAPARLSALSGSSPTRQRSASYVLKHPTRLRTPTNTTLTILTSPNMQILMR